MQERCIYCRKPLTGAEPPEHVIPQSFGTFNGPLANPTLFCVCEGCNKFFGSKLEWPMRIVSAEGVQRFAHGVATAGQIGNIGTKGIELRINEAGPWFGARVVLKVNAAGNAQIDLIAQVGARRRDSDDPLTWHLEKDLNAEFAAKYDRNSEFRIIGGDKDYERLEERLTELFPSFRREGMLPTPIGDDGKVGIAFTHGFEDAVRRLLAKIAFNYLAWVTSAEFVLSPEFDPIRNFIRFGTEPAAEVVRVGSRPILANEIIVGRKITNGHIVTVEALPEQCLLQAQLALFNSLTYRIVLSENYTDVWFGKGHHFDIEERTVTELGQSRIVQPVML